MDYLMMVLLSGYNEVLYYLSAHVLLCLVPAFFIAGGIGSVLSSGAVLKYFGPRASKPVAYGTASVSGSVLAVCSCTILPIFAGIYKKGAGLGPAVTFLFAGPAINILAISLTARQMGFELGLGRMLGAILFSIIVGLIMASIFLREEEANQNSREDNVGMFDGEQPRPMGQIIAFFGILIAILVFGTMTMQVINKIVILSLLMLMLAFVLIKWFTKDEVIDWLRETWRFVKLIFPVLMVGVFVAGVLKVIIPDYWVSAAVGGNSLTANLIASVVGALMYFSTLTEVPIVSAFLEMGMGKGPALALLLAGPSLSLPNMLVIRNVIGVKKTIVYVLLVVSLSTTAGMIFGFLTS